MGIQQEDAHLTVNIALIKHHAHKQTLENREYKKSID